MPTRAELLRAKFRFPAEPAALTPTRAELLRAKFRFQAEPVAHSSNCNPLNTVFSSGEAHLEERRKVHESLGTLQKQLAALKDTYRELKKPRTIKRQEIGPEKSVHRQRREKESSMEAQPGRCAWALCGGPAVGERADYLPASCRRCYAAAYCGRKCQVADWKAGHKRVCKRSPLADVAVSGRPSVVVWLASHVQSQKSVRYLRLCLQSFASTLPASGEVGRRGWCWLSVSAATPELRASVEALMRSFDSEDPGCLRWFWHGSRLSQLEHFSFLRGLMLRTHAQDLRLQWVLTTDDDDLWHYGRYDMYYQSLLQVAETPPGLRDQVVSLCAPHFVAPFTAALRDSAEKQEDVERALAAQQLDVRTLEEGIDGFAWRNELWSYLVPFRVLNEYFAQQRQPALLQHPLADVDVRSFIASHPGFGRAGGGKTVFLQVPLQSSWCYFYRQVSRESKVWEVQPWPGEKALRARYERLFPMMFVGTDQPSLWPWLKQMVTLFWMHYRWNRQNTQLTSRVLKGLMQACRPRVDRG
eukprot:g53872.t1